MFTLRDQLTLALIYFLMAALFAVVVFGLLSIYTDMFILIALFVLAFVQYGLLRGSKGAPMSAAVFISTTFLLLVALTRLFFG